MSENARHTGITLYLIQHGKVRVLCLRLENPKNGIKAFIHAKWTYFQLFHFSERNVYSFFLLLHSAVFLGVHLTSSSQRCYLKGEPTLKKIGTAPPHHGIFYCKAHYLEP
ncbi:unnamed protein product [Schistosoma mansoni]|uniref:Smp_205900 n=1 Tax=Schistosoma mansoni TaxID=6183 RepID=UPI00022C869B|nr:unnamed protein product [Schistosoma mansoni]|eukprot:XP_018644788.1 unnamed protein product [Schistosoma mansoni]